MKELTKLEKNLKVENLCIKIFLGPNFDILFLKEKMRKNLKWNLIFLSILRFLINFT